MLLRWKFKPYQFFYLCCSLALTMMLTACGGLNLKDEYAGWGAEKFYAEAKQELADGNWQSAIKMYEKLETRFPYGRYAQQAQIESAYAYWKNNEPASAIATCDRFLRLHPDHKATDYVLYLKGVVGYNEETGLSRLVTLQDPSLRDQKPIRDAFESFNVLLKRFPNSPYAPDAKQRMMFLLNTMAKSEVAVARHYFSREAYLAAVNRAEYSIKTYPEATANEEALSIVIQSYQKLGLKELADDARRVMQNNFPQSKYLPQANNS